MQGLHNNSSSLLQVTEDSNSRQSKVSSQHKPQLSSKTLAICLISEEVLLLSQHLHSSRKEALLQLETCLILTLGRDKLLLRLSNLSQERITQMIWVT